MSENDSYGTQFLPLFADLEQDEAGYPHTKPLLAHYTSMATCEKILVNNEIWFSNPLLMNDWQEVRFGIIEGTQRAFGDQNIADACGSKERAGAMVAAIAGYRNHFENEHALDTYLFCLSLHERDDTDGILSMWRGYGGQGDGVAIIIDTDKIEERDETPFVIAPVKYASDQQRFDWFDGLFLIFANALKSGHIPDDKLHIPAWWLMERIKLFAIFTKHAGFREEYEWRVAYLPWRDEEKHIKPFYSYAVTPSGVQPKLKLPIREIPGLVSDQFSLENLVESIILGPGCASTLSRITFERMIELVRPGLAGRVKVSGIPFRKT